MQNNSVNFNQIEEIREKADIVSIIGKYIKLSKKGANYFGICPFHADHNPSLVVSPSKRIWKCFVCGAKGNVFTFVQKYKKVSFLEAVKEVAIESGFDISSLSFLNRKGSFLNLENKRLVDANKYTNDLYKSFLKDPNNKQYLDYLKKRGLDEQTINFFEFGYAPKEQDLIYNILTNNNNFLGSQRSSELTWNEKELIDAGIIYLDDNEKPVDFLIDRVTIPIYDNNNYVVGFSGRTIGNSSTKYLNTGATKIFSKGNLLFNFNRVRELNDKKLIIVEGFMDAIALYNCGHKNVVATMGVALTEKHLNLLHSLELDTVILCFDNDSAGQLATIENGTKLMNNGFNVYVVGKYDSNIKDVDELMQSKGKEAVNHAIDSRIDFISYLIQLNLSKSIPLDEIQTKITWVLKQIVEYGDPLLRNFHFKEITKVTGFSDEDLTSKLNQLLRARGSYYIPNFSTRKKTEQVAYSNLSYQEIVNQKIKEDTDIEQVDNLINAHRLNEFAKHFGTQRLINGLNELIGFLLVHNEYISQACDQDLAFSAKLLILPEVKTIYKLNFIYKKYSKATIQLLSEVFNQEKEDGLNDQLLDEISQADEFDYEFDDNKQRVGKKYKALLKTINLGKMCFLQSCKIEQLFESPREKRSELLKDLIDTQATIKKILKTK